MENVKYILIVSQYYYSHHCFVVSATEENFREKALTLIEKLEDYKRQEGDPRGYDYGDFSEGVYSDQIIRRRNINDSGDIYFIPCQSLLSAMRQSEEYNTNFQLSTRYKGMPKKQREKIETQVLMHHSFDKVKNIVGSVFNIL